MQAVSYATNTAPPAYRCTGCGATGVKLWRLPHGANDLLNCVDCLCKRKDLDGDPITPGSVSGEGSREDRYGRSDQIAGLLPAVPDEEGVSYWSYSSVPEAGVKWWKALPLRMPRPAEWPPERRLKLIGEKADQLQDAILNDAKLTDTVALARHIEVLAKWSDAELIAHRTILRGTTEEET